MMMMTRIAMVMVELSLVSVTCRVPTRSVTGDGVVENAGDVVVDGGGGVLVVLVPASHSSGASLLPSLQSTISF